MSHGSQFKECLCLMAINYNIFVSWQSAQGMFHDSQGLFYGSQLSDYVSHGSQLKECLFHSSQLKECLFHGSQLAMYLMAVNSRNVSRQSTQGMFASW